MTKYFYIMAMFLGLVIMVPGCQSDSSSANLLCGFKSRSTMDDLQSLFNKIGIHWNEGEKFSVSHNSDNKDSISSQITINEFSCFGDKGVLKLNFFNNQLVSTVFYPSDWGNYKHVVEYQVGKEVTVGSKYFLNSIVKVSIVEDFEKKIFVSWTDVNLSKLALSKSD